jgi:hypothetical protein
MAGSDEREGDGDGGRWSVVGGWGGADVRMRWSAHDAVSLCTAACGAADGPHGRYKRQGLELTACTIYWTMTCQRCVTINCQKTATITPTGVASHRCTMEQLHCMHFTSAALTLGLSNDVNTEQNATSRSD